MRRECVEFMERRASLRESGWLGDRQSAFARDPIPPRTNVNYLPGRTVLGNFLSSLRDLSCCEPKTQHFVLGYFQPSLRDWHRHVLKAGLFSASVGRIR
jgi:hypothetical protein